MNTVIGDRSSPSFTQRRVAIGALVAAQAGDSATTLYGIRLPGVVELNPVVAAAVAHLGPTGVLYMAVLAVFTVVAVTETAVFHYEGTALTPGRLRCFGYLPHILLSMAATLNNLFVVGIL